MRAKNAQLLSTKIFLKNGKKKKNIVHLSSSFFVYEKKRREMVTKCDAQPTKKGALLKFALEKKT